MLVLVYTYQNSTSLEITYRGSLKKKVNSVTHNPMQQTTYYLISWVCFIGCMTGFSLHFGTQNYLNLKAAVSLYDCFSTMSSSSNWF